VRYPRGSALGVKLEPGFSKIEIGKAEKLSDGEDVAILAVGSMVNYADKAAAILKESGISSELVNMRFIKPLDTQLLDEIASKHEKIVTIEENNLPGGFGSAVLEYFNDKNFKNDILRIGIPDTFIDHGTQSELHKQISIDPAGIVSQITTFFKSVKSTEKVTY
jgi:1-deoxy-D-xylulose-5-phosphate synthase